MLGEDELLLVFIRLNQFCPHEHLQILSGIVRLQFRIDSFSESDATGVDLVLDLLENSESGLEGERLRGAWLAGGEVIHQEVTGCQATTDQ